MSVTAGYVHVCALEHCWKHNPDHNPASTSAFNPPSCKFRTLRSTFLGPTYTDVLLLQAGLVFNTAFATLLLKEPFTRFSLIGTILTCAGAATIATFGAIGEPAHSLSQLLDLLNQRPFILWMIGTMLVAIGTIVFAHILKVYTKRTHHEARNHELRRAHSRSVSSSHPDLSNLKRTFTAQLPPILQNRISRIRLVRGLAYALISGILSAHSLLVAKTAVELLVRTIVDHNNQFNSYQSWLIVLTLLFFALTQLYYLHLGLRLCSTSILYPFVFCIYNIIAILDGLIYFRQGSRLSALHAGLIAVGTVILLTGVLALSWRLDDSIPTDPPVPQSTEPENFNPLTPGMGLMCSGEDSPRSPLLPTVRPRSSASASRHSVNEQTPLLYHRLRRTPTLNIYPPPPDPGAENIWAELDDEGNESDHDILASLPRTPSPFLQPNRPPLRRRSRGTSLSFAAMPTSNPNSLILPRKRGSAGSADSARYRDAEQVQAWQSVHVDKERRRSSAPVWISGNGNLARTPISKSTSNLPETLEAANGSAAVATTAYEDPRGDEHGGNETNDSARNFSATVSEDAPVLPSRWDTSWSRWWHGRPNKNAGDKDPGG